MLHKALKRLRVGYNASASTLAVAKRTGMTQVSPKATQTSEIEKRGHNLKN